MVSRGQRTWEALRLQVAEQDPLRAHERHTSLPACLGVSTLLSPVMAVMVEKPASRQRVMSRESAFALNVGSALAR